MSLVSEGFVRLGTLKIPALASRVASNIVMFIGSSAYTDDMTRKLKSNGDDLRFTYDSEGLNRLPIETEGLQYTHTLIDNAASDNLIYVWGNNPTAIKEIDTAPYGKHAVSVNKDFKLDTLDGSDNSGNDVAVTETSSGTSITYNRTAFLGKSLRTPVKVGGDTKSLFLQAVPISGDYTYSTWFKLDAAISQWASWFATTGNAAGETTTLVSQLINLESKLIKA
jgi:hypothetical protein